MGRACCVLGCPSGGDAPSHQIPKNPALFQKWKSLIYSEKIQHLTDEQISKCAVCYRHFAEDDYLVTFRVRKLKRGIAPSLNLPNQPGNCMPRIVRVESIIWPETSNTDTSISIAETEMAENQGSLMQETEIALFEDPPEKLELHFPKQLQQNSLDNYHIEQTNSTAETFKLYCRKRALKKKRAKLMAKQLTLLRCKKQVEQYEKTPAIQTLLSSLTLTETASIKTRIRKSKYSPKAYIRIYHDIAKRKALGLSYKVQ